jgi:hypothetical protein
MMLLLISTILEATRKRWHSLPECGGIGTPGKQKRNAALKVGKLLQTAVYFSISRFSHEGWGSLSKVSRTSPSYSKLVCTLID